MEIMCSLSLHQFSMSLSLQILIQDNPVSWFELLLLY